MKIIRNGKEFELTKDELFQAYYEQQELFDVENIEMNLDTYLDEDEYELLKNNKEFIEEAAYQLRRNQDKYNMDYDYALEDAITETSARYLE